MLSLAHRLAARIAELDAWDDGGDMILDSEAGGRIISYTGSHAWNAGAGHEAPPVAPYLRLVRDEIVDQFSVLPPQHVASLRDSFTVKVRAFDERPSMVALLELADIVDRITPLYADIEASYDIGSSNNIVERGYGGDDSE